MEKAFDFICQGSLCTELLARVDRYPGAGDAIIAESVRWTGGGMAANTAAAIALLGGRVAILTAIGDDYYGQQARDGLRKTGVNVEYLKQHTGQSTLMVILMVNPSLQRAGLVLDIDEDYHLQSEEVPEELIQSSKVFFTDMSSIDTSIALAKRAKHLGLKIACDMQMTEAHINSPNLNQKIGELFELTDYYFADLENFLHWTGAKDCSGGCRKLLDQYSEKTLVITKGKDGSTITNSSTEIEIPAFRVDVVDTIGAGDAFHGAFLYGHIILGMDLRASGILASAASAISCMSAGARDGLPSTEKVIDFLGKRKISLDLNQ